MLIIQQNRGKKNWYIISALETAFGLEALIICIKNLFLGNQSLVDVESNLY